MRTYQLTFFKEKFKPGLLIIFFIAGLLSCSREAAFQQSSVVPAADGKVKVKQDNNENYKIKVEVSDLAEADKLYSNSYRYVVWMETDEGRTENLGQLVSATGFLSQRHKATLETVTSFEPIKIFITAEDEKNIRYPGNKVILTTRRF